MIGGWELQAMHSRLNESSESVHVSAIPLCAAGFSHVWGVPGYGPSYDRVMVRGPVYLFLFFFGMAVSRPKCNNKLSSVLGGWQ